jgi:hypothetical protein
MLISSLPLVSPALTRTDEHGRDETAQWSSPAYVL